MSKFLFPKNNEYWKLRDHNKMVENIKKAMNKKETKEKLKVSNKNAWSKPEVRKKYIDAFKKRHNPSKESNLKRSLKLKGRTSPTKGMKFSEEVNKKKGRNGELNAMSRPEIKQKQLMACRTYGKQWKNGISKLPYSFDFNNNIKNKIKERDNYTCQLCKEQILKNTKNKFLTIHHIDYNKLNTNKNNLITLCNFCNSSVNFKREDWLKYFINIIKNKYGELKLWI